MTTENRLSWCLNTISTIKFSADLYHAFIYQNICWTTCGLWCYLRPGKYKWIWIWHREKQKSVKHSSGLENYLYKFPNIIRFLVILRIHFAMQIGCFLLLTLLSPQQRNCNVTISTVITLLKHEGQCCKKTIFGSRKPASKKLHFSQRSHRWLKNIAICSQR